MALLPEGSTSIDGIISYNACGVLIMFNVRLSLCRYLFKKWEHIKNNALTSEDIMKYR